MSNKRKGATRKLKICSMNHCKRENHIMDWDKVKVISTENNRHQHWLMEAIEIRKRAQRTMNLDKGAYMLSYILSNLTGTMPQ